VTTTDTHQALLDAAIETCRLQLLSRRDRELIAAVLTAFPEMSEAEVVQRCSSGVAYDLDPVTNER
jgi:hypothetical protein